ncbi:MAG: hypothetical protein B7Z55_15610 [Planctomycetales bacterium 12-60-4]|nr:MAG: hypothetical protein B7Z55_15610 [Planctomycetales bacterium 12-60-4]
MHDTAATTPDNRATPILATARLRSVDYCTDPHRSATAIVTIDVTPLPWETGDPTTAVLHGSPLLPRQWQTIRRRLRQMGYVVYRDPGGPTWGEELWAAHGDMVRRCLERGEVLR